jgi:hypothetical protein
MFSLCSERGLAIITFAPREEIDAYFDRTMFIISLEVVFPNMILKTDVQ